MRLHCAELRGKRGTVAAWPAVTTTEQWKVTNKDG